MRREIVTECTSGGYDQFETSPEEIEQELRPAVCERRQTDLRQIIIYIVLFDDHSRATDLALVVFTKNKVVFSGCGNRNTVNDHFNQSINQ